MASNVGFFGHYKYCEDCHQMLPAEYEFDVCPRCTEERLFREVRDFIRKNEVTEYDVAEEFGLPVKRVKSWIREGRIQYQQDGAMQSLGNHCARCGEVVVSGEFCPKCLEYMRRPKGTVVEDLDAFDESRMRFLENFKK